MIYKIFQHRHFPAALSFAGITLAMGLTALQNNRLHFNPEILSQAAMPAQPPALPPGNNVHVSRSEGKLLSIVANQGKLADILGLLQAQTHIGIIMTKETGNREITLNIQNLPLDQVLMELFSGMDVFYQYGAVNSGQSRLKCVWVYPGGGADFLQPMAAGQKAAHAGETGTPDIGKYTQNSEPEAEDNDLPLSKNIMEYMPVAVESRQIRRETLNFLTALARHNAGNNGEEHRIRLAASGVGSGG